MPNLYKELNRDHKNDGIASDGQASKAGAPAVKPFKPDYTKYQDTTGELSGTDLKRYIWFTKNQVLLYRLLVSFLIAFIVFAFGYSLWGIGNYVALGYWLDQKIYQELGGFYDYTGIHARYGAQPLQVLSVDAIESGVNKFDEIAQLLNPNERFIAEFDYYFDFGGGVSTTRERATLMPLENRPVGEFGLDSGAFGGAGNLVIDNVSWTRVSNHDVTNIQEFLDNHSKFTASSVVFTNSARENAASAHVISFDLTNGSAYSYYAPKFLIGLFQGGALVGVIPWQSDSDFYSLQTKKVDIRSFVTNLNVDQVEVYPLINWFDSESFVIR